MWRYPSLLALGATLVLWAPGAVQAQDLMCGMAQDTSASEPEELTAGYQRFPFTGRVHALVVFVRDSSDVENICFDSQTTDGGVYDFPLVVKYSACEGDTSGVRYYSPSADPDTGWPAYSMPGWADTFIDSIGTDPEDYTVGSLSDYYWTMSRGNLGLRALSILRL